MYETCTIPAQSLTVDDQIMVEGECVEIAVKKYRDTNRDARLADTMPGRRIFEDAMRNMVPIITKAQNEAIEGIANGGRGVKPVWWWFLPMVEAEKLAFIAIRSILSIKMNEGGIGRKASAICAEIGGSTKNQVEFEKWRRDSAIIAKENDSENFAEKLIRRTKNFNQRQFSNWKRKIDSIENLDWSRAEKLHLGAMLLKVAVEHSGGYFRMEYVQIRNKTERQVFLTDECRMMIEDINSNIEANHPVLRPTVVPPKPWVWTEDNNRYMGGYHLIEQDLIRGGLHKHTAALDQPLSQATLDAVSSLGNVPWQIDRDTLGLLIEGYLTDSNLFHSIPPADTEPLPQRKTEAEWDGLSAEDKAEWKYLLSKVHGQNARSTSKREAAFRKIEVAKSFAKYEKIYYPHKLDSRTRIYPIPTDVNAQADGVGRGLMKFANGHELGDRGFYWLQVRLAHAFGEDKLSWNQYEGWVKDHHDLIIDTVRDPLNGHRFWAKAESELEFYQTALEYAQASALSNPGKFVSYLPVHQDGSNNGLQLLSLLGRDPVGAKATNCSSDQARSDIYGETAEIVKQMVSIDAAAGVQEAMAWIGNIHRATVKRATMTLAYGVTPRGIQDQLIKDRHTEGLDGGRMANARYLRDKILIALNQTVVAARTIMDYFQNVAEALSDYDQPMQWCTPAGSHVVQSYYNVAKSDVKTIMGSIWLWDENPQGGLNTRKQILASSPNVIHSLDAALAQKVINRMREDFGVSDFASIHDSFGVPACHVDTLRDVIREVAYDMFKGDWIKDSFHFGMQYRNPGIELPEPPTQGTFDPKEVLSSPYFFA